MLQKFSFERKKKEFYRVSDVSSFKEPLTVRYAKMNLNNLYGRKKINVVKTLKSLTNIGR